MGKLCRSASKREKKKFIGNRKEKKKLFACRLSKIK
jgi:hypothetical protein